MSILSLQTQAHDLIDKNMEAQARGILKYYRDARDEILETLKDNYAKYLTGISPDSYWTVMAETKRLEKINSTITGIYTKMTANVYEEVLSGQMDIFNEGFFRHRFVSEAFGGTGVANVAFNPLVSELSVTGDFEIWKNIRNERVKEIAEGLIPKTGVTLKELLANNASEDLLKIQKVIKQGFVIGRSYSKQIDALKPVFNNAAYKAQRVVRTEGNRNMNAGAQFERESSGMVKKKQWVSTLDAKTRHDHQMLDGQEVGVKERFRVSGDSALYPGDFADPSQNINCRCTVIDIIEGIPPTARRGKNPITGKSEIISYKNYEEWKASYV